MNDIGLKRITGQANSTSKQQFQQVVATTIVGLRFWAFQAVNGDAVITSLTNDDTTSTSALGYLANATAYESVLYCGQFKSIKLTSGSVVLYLSEQ
jgi:hypothetical protein